jgi:hypothetical protein
MRGLSLASTMVSKGHEQFPEAFRKDFGATE